MTRAQLIEILKTKYPLLSTKQVDDMVRHIFLVMVNTLSHKDRIEIRDFGIFTAHDREARIGCNPKLGTPVIVSAKVKIRFKPGKKLRYVVNNSQNNLTYSL